MDHAPPLSNSHEPEPAAATPSTTTFQPTNEGELSQSSHLPAPPPAPPSNESTESSESTESTDPPGTIGSFLWQLLSSAIADDTAFDHKTQSAHPSQSPKHNPTTATATPEQPNPIHIEFPETKHSLIDLSEGKKHSDPIPIHSARPLPQIPHSSHSHSHSHSLPDNHSHTETLHTSPLQNPISSIFSYGKQIFSQISQPGLPSSSPPAHLPYEEYDIPAPQTRLNTTTREERDSLLDLHTAMKPVTLLRGGKLPQNAPVILSAEIAEKIRPALPPLHRESSTWRLIYSLDHHGISLNTMYHNCEPLGTSPVLLVIKNTDGEIFGAYASEAFRVNHGYFGNGSCFLWKATESVDGGSQPDVRVFKATGANDYLILGEAHMIALGGGEGHFGLWVDQDLYNGHSGPCQTFNNERLSSKAEFVIQSLELWAFEM